MSLPKQDQLLIINQLLYKGIIEIRILASRGTESKRINNLANLLHKIPEYIDKWEEFNISELEKYFTEYQNYYQGDTFDFLSIINKLK
jgi:hypothetical protein